MRLNWAAKSRNRATSNHAGDIPILLRTLGLLLLLTLVGAARLQAIEKHWIARQAQVIVVGTYKPNLTYPWFDGWRLTGEIRISEVLYGPRIPGRIRLKLVCPWAECDSWPPPTWPHPALLPSLWFLRRIDEDTWEPSLGVYAPGPIPLSERAYWERWIQQYKIHPWPGFNTNTSTY